jgi:hypothetical protein
MNQIPTRLLQNLPLFSECDLKVYLSILESGAEFDRDLPVDLDKFASSFGFTRRSVSRSLTKLQGFGLLDLLSAKSLPNTKTIRLLNPALVGDGQLNPLPLPPATLPVDVRDIDPTLKTNTKRLATTDSNVHPQRGVNVQKGGHSPPETAKGGSNDRTLASNAHPATRSTPVANKNINKAAGKERESEGEENQPSTNAVPNDLRFHPRSKLDLLALDIARAFDDLPHLPMYRHFCQTVPEQVVRRAFSETLRTPQEKIKKSQPALFIYLLRTYAYPPKDQNPRP